MSRITNRDLFALTLRYAMESDLAIERYAKYRGEKTPSLFADDDKPSWVRENVWDESKHPRVEKGSKSAHGGQFTSGKQQGLAGLSMVDAIGKVGDKKDDRKKPDGIESNEKLPLFEEAAKVFEESPKKPAKVQDDEDQFPYAGMSLDQAADLAARNGHDREEAKRKISNRPSAWISVLEDWKQAEATQKSQDRKEKRDANWKPNEDQKKVLDAIGDSRVFPKSQDFLSYGANIKAMQSLEKKGIIDRVDNGKEVSYRVLKDFAPKGSLTPEEAYEKAESLGENFIEPGVERKSIPLRERKAYAESLAKGGMLHQDITDHLIKRGIASVDARKLASDATFASGVAKEEADKAKPKESGIIMPSKTVPNEEAKPGDQLGLFGDAVKAPKTTFKPKLLDQPKQGGLFDTKGNPDQMDLFGDGVMPDDMVYKPDAKKDVDADAVAKMAPGANKRMESESKGREDKTNELEANRKWAENHITIAADDVSKLRKQDVYRVLDNAPNDKRGYLESWIQKQRPDLSQQVNEDSQEIDEERANAKSKQAEPKPFKPKLISKDEWKDLTTNKNAKPKTTIREKSIRDAVKGNGGHEKNSANDVDKIRDKLYYADREDGTPPPSHKEIRDVIDQMKVEAGQKYENSPEGKRARDERFANPSTIARERNSGASLSDHDSALVDLQDAHESLERSKKNRDDDFQLKMETPGSSRHNAAKRSHELIIAQNERRKVRAFNEFLPHAERLSQRKAEIEADQKKSDGLKYSSFAGAILERYAKPSRPFIDDGDLFYDPIREQYASALSCLVERYEWVASKHPRDAVGRFTKTRELADHPDLQSHHSLHLGNQKAETQIKLKDHARGFRNLIANAGRKSEFNGGDQSEESIWANLDKTALQALLTKMNQADHESMKGDGPKFHELANANQIIPKMIAERLHGGSRFFDPEKLRGRWNEPSPQTAPEQEQKQDTLLTPQEMGQPGETAPQEPPKAEAQSQPEESAQPAPQPAKPKRAPITPEAMQGMFGDKIPNGVSKQMNARLEKSIKALTGDDPEVVREFKSIVFNAWKQMTQEVSDHNQAFRQITSGLAPTELMNMIASSRNRTFDPTKKKNFDILADGAKRQYPDIIGQDAEQGLIKLLETGIKSKPKVIDPEVAERAVTLAGPEFFKQFDQGEPPEQDEPQSEDDWNDQFSWAVARVMVERYRNEPTPAQREAGNYRKEHIRVHGLPISIETKKGDKRRPEWPSLAADYGYFKKTLGKDGDNIDVFVGPDKTSEIVFVIDQVGLNGKFDEHKVLLGFANQSDAIATYKRCYHNDWKVGPVTAMTIAQFKNWIASGKHSRPIAKQVSRYSMFEPQLLGV
jgi:hypothetical protein